MKHIPVLRQEMIEGLALQPHSVVVDCTLGAGGHATSILEVLDHTGTYVGIDLDPAAIKASERLAAQYPASVHLVCGNFRDIAGILRREQIQQPHALLADLGWRSDQFVADEDAAGRGFSFNTDEPLVMTFGDPERYAFTARDIANDWEEESIADIIYGYGEERAARRIAAAIVAAREQGSIETSKQLADIVTNAIPAPFRPRRIHTATKTFQAFRIAVNDELGALKDLLADGFEALAPNGRMAIISFHSLEDRIVKHHFKALEHDQRATRITKKPIIASEDELQANPRARSAKLRIIEKAPL